LAAVSIPVSRAAAGSQFVVTRADTGPILAQAEKAFGPLASVEGEVLEAGGDRCVLRTSDGITRAFVLHAGCPIFANGLPSCLAAIGPVAPGALFWAKIWFDRGNALVALEAVYYGGELELTSICRTMLRGFSPEHGILVSLPIAGQCQPRQLAAGQSIYVLLDLDGRIRWVRVLAEPPCPVSMVAAR